MESSSVGNQPKTVDGVFQIGENDDGGGGSDTEEEELSYNSQGKPMRKAAAAGDKK